MEPTSFSDMLKQFGPYGICLFLMGTCLIYLIRWLREDRKQTDITHEGIRVQFLVALKEQRTDLIVALKDQRSEMLAALDNHSERIDVLSTKVDNIDEHIQELHRMR